MITFKDEKVILDKKHVGNIKKDADGWYYAPKGFSKKHRGPSFKKLSECKKSLTWPD